jgi:hypothetical protein
VEHGAIASLLVPTPDPSIVVERRSLLATHNEAEEGPGGLYQACDELLGPASAGLLDRARAYPPVKTAPHHDGPGVHRTAESALQASARQAWPTTPSPQAEETKP